MTDPLLRHVRRCNNAVLPGGRAAFRVGGEAVGWVDPSLLPDRVANQAALDALSRDLAARGVFGWRDEAFDVRARPDGPVVAQLDRGAIPSFGCMAVGVHLNGLVARADGPHLWVGRRANDKLLDPGKLDHIAAGGVPAGLTPRQALAKEAAEEAGLDAALVGRAVPVGVIAYAMDRPEGLRRDRLHCYDLFLPESVQPRPVDGEVVGFELWPLPRVLAAVRETDDFKFNVNLVLIDLLLRHGLIDPAGAEGRDLRAALDAPIPGWRD